MPSDEAVLTAEAVAPLAPPGCADSTPTTPGMQQLRAVQVRRPSGLRGRPAVLRHPSPAGGRAAGGVADRFGTRQDPGRGAQHTRAARPDRHCPPPSATWSPSIRASHNVDVNDRYDAFFSKRLGFVEVQGASPGGMGFHDATARAFTETSVVRDASPRSSSSNRCGCCLPCAQAMLAAWRDWGGQGDPVIAIVDWADAPLMPEFEIIRDDLHRRRTAAFIADPQELTFSGGRLRCGETPIDLVYRRLIDPGHPGPTRGDPPARRRSPGQRGLPGQPVRLRRAGSQVRVRPAHRPRRGVRAHRRRALGGDQPRAVDPAAGRRRQAADRQHDRPRLGADPPGTGGAQTGARLRRARCPRRPRVRRGHLARGGG